MAEITAKLVQSLRAKTGAGMMDCKVALTEAQGDPAQAEEILRKKGLKSLDKRSGKVAAEGVIGLYLHHGGRVAAMVELNCETDFVARGDDFLALARDIALHVAAMNPRYLSEDEVPEDILEREKGILLEQLNEQQKKMADKILPGKLKKFFDENCLLAQAFVKDENDSTTIKALLEAHSVKTGEKVQISRFMRMEVGEGVEKSVANFAEEVAATIGAS